MTSGLPKKAFPDINLSKFKLSGSSVSSQGSLTPFPDYSNLKFVSKQKPMSNLFQYNDRKKLILSSDSEEEEHQPSFFFQQKLEKTVTKEDFNNENLETIKKSKAGPSKEEDKENQHGLDTKWIQPSQVSNQKAGSKKISKIEQENQEEHEQIVLSKVYKIKGPGTNKYQGINKSYSENVNKDSVSIKDSNQSPYQNTQKKKPNQIKIEEQSMQHFQEPIKVQTPENINNAQLTIGKEQVLLQTPNHEMKVIEEQSNSNTQHILERIQSDRHTIIAPSQSQRKLDTIHSYHQAQNTTPRKRKRNKIFDKSSIRRQPSYLTSQRGLTPEKGTVAIQKQQKSVQCEQQVNRDLFPQIKALNILDKLVDQIDHERVKPRIYNNAYQKQASLDMAGLIDFNKFLLSEIIAFQSISCITELAQNDFIERMKAVRQSLERWRENVGNYQKSVIPHDACIKFSRLNELFLTIFTVCNKYKETVARLDLFQRKLEDFVMILRTKDSKKLYLLRRQLNVQLQLLYQLRAGCGDTKYQKLFSQYLSNEIQLLRQIKEDIDGNFNSQLPILKF